MKRSRPALPMAFTAPLGGWFEVARKSGEISTSAAQVIATRVARMAAAGATPSAADRREMHRMVDEKMQAWSRAGAACVGESATWMMKSAVRNWMLWATLPMTWWGLASAAARPSGLAVHARRSAAQHGRAAARHSAAAAKIVDATLAPVHTTVKANARRLSRRG